MIGLVSSASFYAGGALSGLGALVGGLVGAGVGLAVAGDFDDEHRASIIGVSVLGGAVVGAGALGGIAAWQTQKKTQAAVTSNVSSIAKTAVRAGAEALQNLRSGGGGAQRPTRAQP
jgi:hypothetical protein